MKQPEIPIVLPQDWLAVFVPLTFGIISFLFLMKTIAPKHGAGSVVTFTNFWLTLSGIIHCWIELRFVFARETSFIKPSLDMYGAADFRYSTPMEPGTAAMEAITAILEGPMCLLVVYAAVQKKSWQHPLQLVLTTMQIYGLLWFAIQPYFSEDGYSGHFSADPIMFWVIAVGANAPWGIVPPILFYISFKEICHALGQKPENTEKAKSS